MLSNLILIFLTVLSNLSNLFILIFLHNDEFHKEFFP